MPRQSRIDTAGALHHIIVRGIERGRIFNDDEDREFFIDRLGLILGETKTACYAWALIPNHFHLLLRTGDVSIATVMRRLLTGHAIWYNRRHRRHGHVFQNRYKSILCQEEAYFLELVRYIHLNPLRALLVPDIESLDSYTYSGHSAIMGSRHYSWQDCETVLTRFGKHSLHARREYREYIAAGKDQGRRPNLTGGGLIRSAGGWTAVLEQRKGKTHAKSDERILGDGDFVDQVLAEADDLVEFRHRLRSRGIGVEDIAKVVAGLIGIKPEEVWHEGRYRHLVIARSLICYWSVRELGESMASMARRFKVSTVAVSKSVRRGAQIVREEGHDLVKLIS